MAWSPSRYESAGKGCSRFPSQDQRSGQLRPQALRIPSRTQETRIRAVRLSVLVPVYNEERTLEEVVRRVCDFQIPKEIILVDDGSQDQSRTILSRLQEKNARAKDPLNQIKVFFQPVNQGKGAALKAALSHVTGDIVIVQDADLEYDPKDYPSLLAPIQA